MNLLILWYFERLLPSTRRRTMFRRCRNNLCVWSCAPKRPLLLVLYRSFPYWKCYLQRRCWSWFLRLNRERYHYFCQKNFRKKSFPFYINPLILSAVSMQVQNEFNRLLFMNSMDEGFDSLNLGNSLSPLSIPAPIEVKAICIAPIIAENDSINIHHRYTIDIEFPQNELNLGIGLCEFD